MGVGERVLLQRFQNYKELVRKSVSSLHHFRKVLRMISSGSGAPGVPSALGLFGLFLGFLPFSIFYRAYISCHYQKY